VDNSFSIHGSTGSVAHGLAHEKYSWQRRRSPADHLERTFRPVDPDGALLAASLTVTESDLLAVLDEDDLGD
jgi:hypothetical protein